jgi:hypothetical protein
MLSYGAELITNLCRQNETAVLMLEQSKLKDGFKCLMLSIRVGEQALPCLWVVKTRVNVWTSYLDTMANIQLCQVLSGVMINC